MNQPVNNGGPAFPSVYYSEPIGSIGPQLIVKGGMDLRDYFAAAALQGILSSTQTGHSMIIAKDAYGMADAMLKAREVKP